MRGRGRLLAYANYRSRQKVYRAEICIMRCCESVFMGLPKEALLSRKLLMFMMFATSKRGVLVTLKAPR